MGAHLSTGGSFGRFYNHILLVLFSLQPLGTLLHLGNRVTVKPVLGGGWVCLLRLGCGGVVGRGWGDAYVVLQTTMLSYAEFQ